jgi:hypothetical protein
MALKPQNDREMKGFEGSNPPFSTKQSSKLDRLRAKSRCTLWEMLRT